MSEPLPAALAELDDTANLLGITRENALYHQLVLSLHLSMDGHKEYVEHFKAYDYAYFERFNLLHEQEAEKALVVYAAWIEYQRGIDE